MIDYIMLAIMYFVVGGFINRRKHPSSDVVEPFIVLLWPAYLISEVGSKLAHLWNSMSRKGAKKIRAYRRRKP